MTTKQGPTPGAVADDDACLLNYLPSTYPSPVQTGSAQAPAQAVINTAALPRSGQATYCNQITIAVPVGADAGCLFQQTPVASANTGKWTVASTLRKKGHELSREGDDTDYATFMFECRDQSDYLLNYNLVFGLSGQVAPLASQCQVLLMENSGTSPDPSTFTSKTCSYTLTTSTPVFYLQNFVATASGAPTVPATEFPNGADINLSWESNGTFFQLYQKNIPKPIYAGTQTAFTLKGGVKTDTTFFLVAMVSGDPSGDKPQSGYQPVYLYDALTVTISNPDLTPNSANVAGALTAKGPTTLADLGVGGTLNATGAANIAKAYVSGSLGVGTSGPQQKLSVSAALNVDQDNLNNGSINPGISFGSQSGEGVSSKRTAGGNLYGLDLYTNFAPRVSITQGGNVGIGTTNPTQALLVVNGVAPAIAANQYGYLNNRDPTGMWNAPQQVQYSIWASYRIASVEFNAFSDGRIKEVFGRSDGAADLRTLLSLEVTDYRHKDAVGKGGAPQKKLVAQQVERVFPQAVGKTTEAVPDIYTRAPLAGGGWVELATDLRPGERVRLIAEGAEGVYEVLEVRPGGFRTDFRPEADAVFVYGREVGDFRTLDYDAIAMLNVSATQQLKLEKDAEVETLRAECAGLKSANDALAERLRRLEGMLKEALGFAAPAANGAGRKL